MLRSGHTVSLSLLTCLWPTPEARAQSSSNVVVAFSTTNTTPLNPGFAGFATEILDTVLEYDNTNFQQFASMLSSGRRKRSSTARQIHVVR